MDFSLGKIFVFYLKIRFHPIYNYMCRLFLSKVCILFVHNDYILPRMFIHHVQTSMEETNPNKDKRYGITNISLIFSQTQSHLKRLILVP